MLCAFYHTCENQKTVKRGLVILAVFQMTGSDNRRFWVGYLPGNRLFFFLFHKLPLVFVYFVFFSAVYALQRK